MFHALAKGFPNPTPVGFMRTIIADELSKGVALGRYEIVCLDTACVLLPFRSLSFYWQVDQRLSTREGTVFIASKVLNFARAGRLFRAADTT